MPARSFAFPRLATLLPIAGALLLGPRIGKFGTDGRANPIPGHNIPYAVLGTIILWFGWFGFNAGSALGANGIAANALLVTNTAAGAATLTWVIASYARTGKTSVVGAAAGAAVTSPPPRACTRS